MSTFRSPTTIDTVRYTLGAAGFAFGEYEFIQSPMCNYFVTVNVTGLPTFVQHQSLLNNFILLSTEDLDVIDTYRVTVTGQISIPDDNSGDPTFTVVDASFTFRIEVLNPCLDTRLDAFIIPDMLSSVQGAGATTNLQQLLPHDSVSTALGDRSGVTFCGPRQFRISSTGHENFLTYDELSHSLTLLSRNVDDVGTRDVTMEAYLVDYPTALPRSSTFKVTIAICEVLSLLPVSTED